MSTPERTLAIIKPNAVAHAAEIEQMISDEGLTVSERRTCRLTQQEAEEFYEEHRGKPFFASLVDFMVSDDVIVLVLCGDNAIQRWRTLLGPTRVTQAKSEAPTSIRAKFGDSENETKNAGHGSDSETSAQREIKFFFPDLMLDSILSKEGAKEYLSKTVSPILVRALTELCKVRPSDPIVWLADWLLDNNPNKNADLNV